MRLLRGPIAVGLLLCSVCGPPADAMAQSSNGGDTGGATLSSRDVLSLLPALDLRDSREQAERAIADLTSRWSTVEVELPAAADSALIVRLWRAEVEHATNCFAGALGAGTDDESGRERIQSCLERASNAEALLPAVDAIAGGENSAVLVVTSVACECVLAACARMSTLYDSLLTSEPQLPLVRFDDMALPRLAEGWDLYEAPTWVFLGPDGNPSFLLEGDIESSVVLSEIEGWTKRDSEKREPGEHD